jgi:hypothetical protein
VGSDSLLGLSTGGEKKPANRDDFVALVDVISFFDSAELGLFVSWDNLLSPNNPKNLSNPESI